MLKLGDRNKILLWHDKWMGNQELSKKYRRIFGTVNKCVVDAFMQVNKELRFNSININATI